MTNEQLINAILELLGEDGWAVIRGAVDKEIAFQRIRLSKLEGLSTTIQHRGIVKTVPIVELDFHAQNNGLSKLNGVKGEIYRVLKSSQRTLGVKEIQRRLKESSGRDMKTATLGNYLWQNKNKLFSKIGEGRWTKWGAKDLERENK